jgi:hypothetical protein
MSNRLIKRIIIAILALSVIAALSACGNEDSLRKGNYYLATDDGADKNSYIEVIDSDTMVFNNVDATEYVEAGLQLLDPDGRFTNISISVPNPESENGEELVITKDSPPEEIEKVREIFMKAFVGEINYYVIKTGDICELYFDKDAVSVGEYIQDSETIKFSGKSYVLEK